MPGFNHRRYLDNAVQSGAARKCIVLSASCLFLTYASFDSLHMVSSAAAQEATDISWPMPGEPSVEDLENKNILGRWIQEDTGALFQIGPRNDQAVGAAEGIKAETDLRVWNGEITQANSGTTRLVFSYKPKAGEMNEQIPSWAREYVDGELEWKIELELDRSCPFWMTGKWYAGEVAWPEGENTQQSEAYVRGRGLPRELKFRRFFHDATNAESNQSTNVRLDVLVEREGRLVAVEKSFTYYEPLYVQLCFRNEPTSDRVRLTWGREGELQVELKPVQPGSGKLLRSEKIYMEPPGDEREPTAGAIVEP